MEKREKAVLRLNDGRLLKGYVKEFMPGLPHVSFEDAEDGKTHSIDSREAKAIFFVKSFSGDQGYKEKKSYATVSPKGNRIFVKFRDGEGLVGFIEGDVPWDRGFFLSRRDQGNTGFFLLPVDEDTNNIKVFVFTASVDAVTVVPKVINDLVERV